MGTAPEESCSGWETENPDSEYRETSNGWDTATFSGADLASQVPDFDLAFQLSEAAFYHTKDALFFTGKDGRIIRCNPAAEEVFGLSQQEILGRPCWEIMHGTTEPPPACSVCLLREDPSHKTIEYQLRGRWFQTEIYSLLHPSSGTLLGVAHILTDVTARKQTEETLRTKTSHLAALLETSRALVAQRDPDRLFQNIVDHAASLTTLGLAALHLRDGGTLRLAASCPPVGADFRAQLARAPVNANPLIEQALSTRTPVVVEDIASVELTPAERRMVELLSVCSFAYVPLVDEDRSLGVLVMGSIGSPHHFSPEELDTLTALADLASVRITASQMENQLAESEERYRSLVELAPLAIAVVQHGHVVYANQAFVRLLGADSPGQVVGEEAAAFLAPEELEPVRLRRDKTIAGEQGLYPAETTWVRLDGTRMTVEVTGVRLVYKGEPALYLIAVDRTPQKAAEQALAEERERLAKVAESFPGAICVFREEPDGSAFFSYASPAVEALCGLTRAELATSVDPLRARIHPADLRQVRESLARASRDLTPWDSEFRYLHPTKGEVWLEAHFLPSRDPDGSTVYTGVILDATERKRAEAEQERTRSQLYQAQKMEAIGRLAGGVAHDFNNMLSVILGYGQSLLDRLSPDDPAREDLGEIVRAAERSAQLTQQLLAFGRKQPAHPETLDLGQLLTEMEPMLKRLLGEDIELSLMPATEPSLVTIDRGQLQQVVMNLLVNAKDAMPQGGRVSLQVKNVQLSDVAVLDQLSLTEGSYVVLSVTDTGHGIPESVLPHIFEPFFTTKEAGVGTGLGLSVVEGVVKQSGGGIAVHSRLGQGTTFEIYLPQAFASPRTTAERVSESAAILGLPRRRHVLVVEDEGSLRVLFERMLGELGYQVTLAADGKEALSLCVKGLQPDVLLSDVVMPGMSGPALAARLLNRLPDLKVVFMSGYPHDAIDHHGGLSADIPFLQKPVTMSSLSSALRELLCEDHTDVV